MFWGAGRMKGIAHEHVVIVGAAEGIGQAMTDLFAEQGAVLTLWDRNPKVKGVAASVGGRSEIVDVTDWSAVLAAAAATEHRQPVTHVLYVVGMGSGKSGFPFWRLEPADWPDVYSVNVQGAVQVVHALVKPMVNRQKGSFVLLSSVSGQFGAQNDPPYSAAKAALISFGQVMAMDLAEFSVRANLIAPGIVDTPMQERVYAANVERLPESERPDYETWLQSKLSKMVPLNRPQTPADVGQAALFLCSDAAQNITGQVLNVDGGWIMKG